MKKKFNSVLIIGMGLIGSSISRAVIENQVTKNVYGLDSDDNVIKKCQELNLLDQGEKVVGTTRTNNFNFKNHLLLGINGKFPIKTINLYWSTNPLS